MTRIDCKVAAECGFNPTQYISQFIRRDDDDVLLAMDEEENGFIWLDVDSAEFLAHKLLTMVGAIHRVFAFKTAHVFDVSQTKGRPLAEPSRVQGEPGDWLGYEHSRE